MPQRRHRARQCVEWSVMPASPADCTLLFAVVRLRQRRPRRVASVRAAQPQAGSVRPSAQPLQPAHAIIAPLSVAQVGGGTTSVAPTSKARRLSADGSPGLRQRRRRQRSALGVRSARGKRPGRHAAARTQCRRPPAGSWRRDRRIWSLSGAIFPPPGATRSRPGARNRGSCAHASGAEARNACRCAKSFLLDLRSPG